MLSPSSAAPLLLGRWQRMHSRVAGCGGSALIKLIINMKTAKTLGLIFPLMLLGRADEGIE